MNGRFINSRTLGLALVGGALLLGSTVQAHISLSTPRNRYGDLSYDNAYQKSSPCGNADNIDGMFEPVAYEPGSTITIRINEYVQHTGFIRVAISDSDQDFIAPTTIDDIGDDPSTVYLMPDLQNGGEHMISVTLPDAPCDPCVMQVIQTMTSGDAFNENYFQCADIILEPLAGTGDDSAGTTGTGDDSAGTTGTGEATTAASDSTAGEATVGSSGSGTTSASTTASGGSGTGGATASEGTGDTDLTGGSNDDDDGCGCRQTNGTDPGWAAVGLLGLFGLRRRRG